MPQQTTPIVAGGWSGTITVHAVMSSDTTQTSESGDPGSVYHTTTTDHGIIQLDASDVLTVSGADDEESAIYGIGSVDLTGPASNNGTTLERTVITSDEYNALGCHYTDEVGTEVAGSWSQSGHAQVSIRFSEDGSYEFTVSASNADPVTGEYTNPSLPKRLWETYTILAGAAKDCPGPGIEQHDTEGPIIDWASSVANSSTMGGQIDPANPGSVVEGSTTFEVTLPDATVTVSWHLVHDGPIVVTPTDFPAE
ncbi:MAG: hypothetical protein QFC55_07640 [Chloroflexota bacterium]|nr:hypothetical protein [Chloroflexota bacterium]